MPSQRALLWLNNDLRLQDHPIFATASESLLTLLPVFCWDPRQFTEHRLGFTKTGPHRAQFIAETLIDLRQRLRERGSDLVIAVGHPENIIPPLAKAMAANVVYTEREVTAEELAVQRALAAALDTVPLKTYWSRTLIHLDDLPFGSIDALPEVFTAFRKKIEAKSPVHNPIPTPDQLPSLPDAIAMPPTPTLADLGLDAPPPEPRAAIAFSGGETEGLQRLQHYLWDERCITTYKATRNGLLGADYSSKFSPWLACGALSPRTIAAEIDRFEQQVTANESTYWLIFELLWRDYFRFVALKHGNKLFHKGGLKGQTRRYRNDQRLFLRWCQGETGQAFIDANMRELAATGFMSNRGRQNVASFLVHDLGIDWRWGAAWFESQLIDYDVCSNYGNWTYVAGVGNDPRQSGPHSVRKFNVRGQAERYDPDGAYVKHWLGDDA